MHKAKAPHVDPPLHPLAAFRKPDYKLPTTIGFELEVNYNLAPDSSVPPSDNCLNSEANCHKVKGFTIGTDHCGYEARSQVFQTWGEVAQATNLVDFFKQNGVKSTLQCGMHIHIGRDGLGDSVVQAKFFTALQMFQDFFATQVPLHRLENDYCRFPSAGSFRRISEALYREVLPAFINPRILGTPATNVSPDYLRLIDSGYSGDRTLAPLNLVKAPDKHSLERSIALTYRPPIPVLPPRLDGSPAESVYPTDPTLRAEVLRGAWVRMQPEFRTFEIRAFHSSLSKTEVLANLATVVLFVERFKEDPDAMLRFLSSEISTGRLCSDDTVAYRPVNTAAGAVREPLTHYNWDRNSFCYYAVRKARFLLTGAAEGMHPHFREENKNLGKVIDLRIGSMGQSCNLDDDYFA